LLIQKSPLIMVATLAALLTIDCGHAQTPIPSAAASAPVSGQPTARPGAQSPAPAVRIDLERFTVNGVGLTSTSDEVRSALGPPQEEQKVSASEELKQQLDEARGDDVPLEMRVPEQHFTRIVYAYFDRGIKMAERIFSLNRNGSKVFS